jgi:hypothetical protein
MKLTNLEVGTDNSEGGEGESEIVKLLESPEKLYAYFNGDEEMVLLFQSTYGVMDKTKADVEAWWKRHRERNRS